MIRQFTYTASPWGASQGGSGWTQFQKSPSLNNEDYKSYHHLFKYNPTAEMDTAHAPVQFIYCPHQSGHGVVLAQTTFIGMRWFGEERPGDYFAHVLLLDTPAIQQSSLAGINPVRLFMSPELQTAFPNSLREKALHIFKKEAAWEPPPDLAELTSLEELPPNPKLTFEAALSALPENAVVHLGAVIQAVFLRLTGKSNRPIAINSSNEIALSLMALAIDLLPPTWRAKTWFALHFPEAVLCQLPEFAYLTFYGTDVNQSPTPDLGIISGVDFRQDPFQFRNHNDVRLFKKQLALLGNDVAQEDYEKLLNFNKICLGRSLSLDTFHSAMSLTARFPGMKDEITQGLTNAFEAICREQTPNMPLDFQKLSVVAWFEYALNFDILKRFVRAICSSCVKDFGLLERMLQCLNSDSARISFLDAVSNSAQFSDAPGFVNKILNAPPHLKNYVNNLPENNLLRLAFSFCDILTSIANNRYAGDTNNALKTVTTLRQIAGPNVYGLAEVERFLGYRHDLATIQSIEAIEPTLRKYASDGFPAGVDAKNDILALNLVDKSLRSNMYSDADDAYIQAVFNLEIALQALHLEGTETISNAWKNDRKVIRQLERDNSELKRQFNELEVAKRKSQEASKKRFYVIITIACVISFVVASSIGLLIGKLTSHSSPEPTITEQSPTTPQNTPEPPTTEVAPTTPLTPPEMPPVEVAPTTPQRTPETTTAEVAPTTQQRTPETTTAEVAPTTPQRTPETTPAVVAPPTPQRTPEPTTAEQVVTTQPPLAPLQGTAETDAPAQQTQQQPEGVNAPKANEKPLEDKVQDAEQLQVVGAKAEELESTFAITYAKTIAEAATDTFEKTAKDAKKKAIEIAKNKEEADKKANVTAEKLQINFITDIFLNLVKSAVEEVENADENKTRPQEPHERESLYESPLIGATPPPPTPVVEKNAKDAKNNDKNGAKKNDTKGKGKTPPSGKQGKNQQEKQK